MSILLTLTCFQATISIRKLSCIIFMSYHIFQTLNIKVQHCACPLHILNKHHFYSLLTSFCNDHQNFIWIDLKGFPSQRPCSRCWRWCLKLMISVVRNMLFENSNLCISMWNNLQQVNQQKKLETTKDTDRQGLILLCRFKNKTLNEITSKTCISEKIGTLSVRMNSACDESVCECFYRDFDFWFMLHVSSLYWFW